MNAIEAAKADARHRIQAANRRLKEKQFEKTLVRKSAVFVTAGIYGTLARYAVANDIGGFPWKVGVFALATLGEGLSSGAMQAALAGVSDATAAVFIDQAVANDTLIAGEYEGDEGSED